MKRNFVVTICIIIYTVTYIVGCAPKKKWDVIHEVGYAPYKIHAEEGWVQDKAVEYPLWRKRFSPDLPKSNFIIQVQMLVKPGEDKYITLEGYINYFKETIETKHKATILSENDLVVDRILAGSILYKHPVTIRNTTREVYSKSIVFTIEGFVYEFSLGTFEQDYPKANADFEKMVKSFYFITDVNVIKEIDKNSGTKTVLQ